LPDPAYAAIDLGATSGRVVAGHLHDGRVELEEVHRFPNRPVTLPDGLRWNLLHLFTESLQGLRAQPAR
jgi:rhamnulokinase